MKACVISTVHNTFDARVFHRECRSLREAGIEVTLICQYEKAEDVVDSVRIIGLPATMRRVGRIGNGWRAFRSALAQRADIYHIHDPELIPWALMLRLSTRKPVIYDVHEHYPDAISDKLWLPAPVRKLASRLFDGGERLTGRFFDALVVADETIAERFQHNRHPVTVLYNYPSRDAFWQAGIEVRETGHSRDVQLVYVGGIAPSRGLWVMLEIVHLLVTQHRLDAGLWLAGPFAYSQDQREFERRLSVDQLLSTRVEWLGRVPHHELPRLLSQADIGLVPLQPIPKFEKNIPSKEFEYMACGLPIVGSDLPPIRRFVETAQAGLLARADDACAHAMQISYLVSHPDEARQMGNNGRYAFETQYNWDREGKKLVSLYETLTSARG